MLTFFTNAYDIKFVMVHYIHMVQWCSSCLSLPYKYKKLGHAPKIITRARLFKTNDVIS